MKIAYDHQTFTVQRYGGISRYFYQLTKHISNMGHNAEIFSPLYINNYIKNLPKELVNGRFVESKYIERMPKKSRIIGGMNRSLSKRQLDLFNPDIVHETFYSKHKTYKKSKCTVITVYDMIHELFNYYQPPYHRGWAEKNISINRADHIICISEHTRKDLIELFGIEKEKTSVVHLAYDNSVIVDEDCSEEELQPQSPYATTKLKEEELITKLCKDKGLKAIHCRFGTIFGASAGMRFHTAVNKFCWQAAMGQPISVWSTAYDQKRPYLDLFDASRAISFIIENDIFDGRVYNVLTNNSTVREVVDVIREFIPDLEVGFVDNKIMNQLSYEVLDNRFKSHGFVPAGSLKRGIGETIALLKQGRSA